MGIVQPPSVLPGQVGVIGAIKYMTTTDSLATVTTAGYLNNIELAVYPILASDVLGVTYSFNTVTNSGTFGLFSVSISNGTITLSEAIASGIVLPTIANHIATYTNTTGTLSEDPATAISGGNIQAGFSGTAGALTSYPSTASEGTLSLAAVSNSSGNFNTTISNASSVAQTQVISIPDSGNATANFILSKGSAQTISTALTVNSLTASSGNIVATTGNLTAGSSGHAGTVTSFPSTATEGSLILAAANNSAGNFTTTISNASSVAQNQTISVPDSGGASANFILTNALAGQSIAQGITVNNTFQANQITATQFAVVNSNPVVVTKVATATFTALATAGKVNIYVAPSGTAQIALLDVKVFFSTGLSGGGGNRLLSVTDGTLVFNNAGITAALLGTPIFTLWGGTGNPLPSSSEATVSTAGANVYLQYIGGTTDYTAGSVIVAVTYAQVTN